MYKFVIRAALKKYRKQFLKNKLKHVVNRSLPKMSSASGIGATQELIDTFAEAVESDTVRTLKVSIINGKLVRFLVYRASLPFSESLVADGVKPRSGSLLADLEHLQNFVEDNVPAYLLVRLDTTASEWLAISYVPDSAKVRDKVCNYVLSPRLTEY